MHLLTEASMEYWRQKLRSKLVNFIYCYEYLDRGRKGLITRDEIYDFFNDSGEIVSDEDIQILISRFDVFNRGFIELNEFVKEFTPKSDFKYLTLP